MRILLDISPTIDYTNRLKKLNRSAFPVAIRGALNDTAFKMKKITMPKKAKKAFIERSPNFFKATSRVEPAAGFEIKKMVSTVGFISSGLHNPSTNHAVKDLEQQEQSGTIHGRSFKPLNEARRGGSNNGLVKSNERISKILKAGTVVDARNSKGKNKMQQFIKASIYAGQGGYVLGGNLLWKVTKTRRMNFGKTTEFKKQKLYSFKKSGTAKVHARGFMRAAAMEVQKEMEFFYRLQAKRQIAKAMA